MTILNAEGKPAKNSVGNKFGQLEQAVNQLTQLIVMTKNQIAILAEVIRKNQDLSNEEFTKLIEATEKELQEKSKQHEANLRSDTYKKD